ncbi:RHS repeat-associated core domain-containing protein [Paenibacillus sp. WLX2291]|uniref:RHS repeat-associated core domain-containing protein n=1 Tax=Paenibacillus sp. WLX2291 TaxID=3296934 RepID=UPI003984172E
MSRYQKRITQQVLLWLLAMLLVFNTNISFAQAAAQPSKTQTKETLSSIQPPSKVAPSSNIEPDAWTTVVNSVYKDVYEAPDPQMQLLEDKIIDLDESHQDPSSSVFSTFAQEDEEGPPTNSDEEATTQLGEQGMYLLLQQGAEPLDIYWIEYLMRLSGHSGNELWQEHQQSHMKWKDLEKKYIASLASVTGDVYAPATSQTKDILNTTSVSGNSLYQATFLAAKLKGSNSTSLSASLSSALDDSDYAQKISDLGKQEYAERTGNSENISSSTGDLSWSATQIHLPGRDGLDLDIGVTYDSSNTSPYLRKSTKKRTAYLLKRSYMHEHNDLGMGWSFQIPSVEGGGMNCNVNPKFYHSSTGQIYNVDTGGNINDSIVQKESGVLLTFIRAIPQDQQFSNGELSTCFIMKHPNGQKEYFSSFGLMIGKVDRYGNTLTYHYQDRKLNSDVTPGWGGFVPSYITDTLGRKVTFDYETTLNQGDEFQGERIIVTVLDPQGHPQQKVVYTKSRVKLIQNGQDQGYFPLLHSITNHAQETQTFDYDQVQAQLRYKSEDNYISDPGFLLHTVTSPRSSTQYEYEQTDRVEGRGGDGKEYRIRSRYDTPLLADNSAGTIMNRVDYTYDGDYTKASILYNNVGAPTPELYQYSQTAHIKSNTASGEKTITNLYNGLHQLLKTQVRTDQGEETTTNYQAFDSTYKYNPTKMETILKDSSGTVTRYKDIVYADWGGTQSETAALVPNDYNNADTKALHTVSYAYEPKYHQATSKTWYQNGGAALSEQYAYTGNGRLQSTTNAAGETTSYIYEASAANANQIQKVTEQKRVRDGINTKVTTTFGADYGYAYPTEQTTIFTNNDKTIKTVRQTMSYNIGTGLLTQQTDSDGNKTTTSYDALGRAVKVVQPSMTNLDGTVYSIEDQYAYTNRVYSTEADSTNAGILTLRVDGIRQYTNKATGAITMLNRQSAYYDGFGFLRVMETYNDSNGWTRSQYHPDDQGRAVYAIDALGNTQTAAYDAWDQQKQFTDADGNLYVTDNQLTQQKVNHFTIAASNVSAYKANANDPGIRLNTVEQTFDNDGNKIKVVAFKDGASRNEPIQESYTYDLAGNVLSYNDPNGNHNSNGVTTSYTYDALNRLTLVQDAIDQSSRYTYDGLGGLSSVIISDNTGKSENLYTKNYNELGQLTGKTSTSGKQTSLTYDARGLNNQQTDRKGTVTTYQYDERGQRTSALMQGKDGSTLQTKSIFGSDGNLLSDRHELYLNGTQTATQTSTIDKLDRITKLTSSGSGYEASLNVNYDPLDRIQRQSNQLAGSSFVTQYGYNKSRLTQIQTDGSGTRTTVATANVQYDYTPLGQVKQITFPTLSDGSVLKETMNYDPLNRLTDLTNTRGGTTLSLYRYTYDANGNILTVQEQQQGSDAKTSNYGYDKLGRLVNVKRADGSESTYTYDLRGNRKVLTDTQTLPSTKSGSYVYDLQNTLTSVSNDNGKTTLDYLPDGLRFKKKIGDKVTQYSYNGADQVIGDKASNGTVSSYVRGDRVLVKKDLTNQKDYYYLYNGHGDVVQMIGTDGNVVNSYQYDEWGSLTQQKETVGNEFKYAGETYDAETGLYYLKARYYDPAQGRFLNEDTYEGEINNPLSLNVYTYVHNNTLIHADPTGNWCASSDGKNAHPGDCSTKAGNFESDYLHDGDQIVSNGNEIGVFYDNDGAHPDHSWTGVLFDMAITGGAGVGKAVISKAISKLYGTAVAEETATAIASGQVFYGGLAGEAFVAGAVGATAKNQLQQRFSTSMGTRIIDVLVKGSAYESKVGYVKYSEVAKKQILKDAEILGSGDIKSYTWHFLRSGVTGKIGADQRLLDLLTQNGIKYIIHK